MAAFAANSILCRLALDVYGIDPASFSLLRLASGAVVLLFLVALLNQAKPSQLLAGEWRASLFLAIYILGFSFAYITLDAGVGALILFSLVQLTMMAVALYEGERPAAIEWVGWVFALMGVLVLVAPGVSAPSPVGLLLMSLAGVAWAGYTLCGRKATQPLMSTSCNFIYATIIVLIPCLILMNLSSLSWQGVMLAVASGAIASGVGYTIWYVVLPHISTMRAALVQLSVPVLAAVGGILFIGEAVAVRFMISCALVLGGIALAISYKNTSKDLS